MNTDAKISPLRLRFEAHQDDKQDQDKKLILVCDEESESFLTYHSHKEGEMPFAAPDARHYVWLHLKWRQQMIQSLPIQ